MVCRIQGMQLGLAVSDMHLLCLTCTCCVLHACDHPQSAPTTMHSPHQQHRGLNVEHKPDGARVVVPPGRPPAAGGAPPPAMALPPNMPSPRTTQPVRTQSQPYTPFDEPDIMPGPSVDYRPTFASPGAGMRYYHATTEDAGTRGGGALEWVGRHECTRIV